MKTENKPVKIISDKAINDARLFGFDAYSDVLAKIILDKNNETPMTIGIHGEWGSGKTSLMQTIKEKLEHHSLIEDDKANGKSGDYRPAKTVWFEAWKYAEEEGVLAAMVEEILKEIQKDKPLWGRIRKFLIKNDFKWRAVFKWISFDLLGTIKVQGNEITEQSNIKKALPFLHDFDSAFEQLIKEIIKSISVSDKDTKESQGVLVIFIDDLDRCQFDRIPKILAKKL